jgi:hypothetical protein
MGDRVEDRPSLKDLDGVRVAVDEVGAVVRSSLIGPLTAETLKAHVEARLRAAGIRIQGMGEFPTGDPHLRLTISPPADRNGLMALAVQLDFVQIVFLRRNPQVTFNRAQTWKADAGLILASTASIGDVVLQDVDDQVDQFVADYRAANP